MFGVGFSELILLAVLALIFIGPEELPKVARTLGRFLNELKFNSDKFKDEIMKTAKEASGLDKINIRPEQKQTEKVHEENDEKQDA